MKIILLGPPGAGKGTQANRLSTKLGVPSVSSGDLFREHQQSDTELGKTARCYMERGILVPDEITIKMVMEWIEDEASSVGFVLDGFPRTLAQAEALNIALSGTDGIDKALFINVSQKELMSRLGGRLLCQKCHTVYHNRYSPPAKLGKCDQCGRHLIQREDDRPAAVEKRIKVYFAQTKPLVDYYREAGILSEIDGNRSISKVSEALEEAIG